jgi:beta-glucanase (GH16 family)
LGFDPTESFHEYRFDYIPGHVLFYADSNLLAQMEGSDMPSSGGHLILQHWSNGNPLWSGGPPIKDATVTVSYVKAYFNSSDHERQSYLQQRCGRSSERAAVCSIQNVTNATSYSGNLPHDSDDNGQSDAAVAEISLLGSLGLGLMILFL